MESNKIDEKLKLLESEWDSLDKYQKMLSTSAQYDGEDKVISSHEAIEEAKKTESAIAFKLDTGIDSLDKYICGFREGQVVIISAPTGHGKTSFAQTLTENFYDSGVKSLWFTYEVPISEFVEKFSTIPTFYLPKQLKQNSLLWLEQKIIEAKVKYDCKVIFIDHLHYLLEMQKMAEAKSLSLLIGMMLREIKRIAIEHKIVIFLICHMKKTLYDKLPEIEDLRDSSFIGQESDTVIFLKRYKHQEEYTNQATLKVAKNRRVGKLGVMKLIYDNNKFIEFIDSASTEYEKL